MAESARPLAVVTGATAGLGRVFSEKLAARGFDLLAVARDVSRLDQLRQELEARHGGAIVPHAADLTREEDVSRLAAVIGQSDRLALLVNNAGFGTLGTLSRTAPEPQADMLRLHTLAPMRLTQAALPGMRMRDRGAIINVSSVASFVVSPGNVNYCATKAYLTTFSEGLASELRGTGVRVQALCPGFTHTEFHQRMRFDKRHIPAFLWMDADRVVETSLWAIEHDGPVVCIPGLRYRLIVGLLRLIPRSWVASATRLPSRIEPAPEQETA